MCIGHSDMGRGWILICKEMYTFSVYIVCARLLIRHKIGCLCYTQNCSRKGSVWSFLRFLNKLVRLIASLCTLQGTVQQVYMGLWKDGGGKGGVAARFPLQEPFFLSWRRRRLYDSPLCCENATKSLLHHKGRKPDRLMGGGGRRFHGICLLLCVLRYSLSILVHQQKILQAPGILARMTLFIYRQTLFL